MLKNLSTDILDFINRRKQVIYYSLFFLVAGFGFKVFNFSLTLDNDWNINMASEKPFSNIDFFFYGNGRYISGFIRKLFSINGAFVPYISAFMAAVLLGISSIIICVIIDKLLENKASNIAFIGFSAIYLSVPFLYSQNFAFDLSVDIECFVAVLITIVAYYLTFSTNVNSFVFILCSLMTALVFNASQGKVVQYLCLFFCILLIKLISSNDVSFGKIISFSHPFILCGVLGLIGYVLIVKIGAVFMNVQYGYIESMIGWTKEQGANTGLLNIARSIKKIFWISAPYGAAYNFISLSIFTLTIISIITKPTKTKMHKIYIICVFLLFFIANFSLCIALGTNMPYRTFLGTPIFLGIGWFLAIHLFHKNYYIEIIVVIACAFVFSKQVLLINTFFYSTYQTAELEKIYAIEIAHDIIRANEGEIPIQPVMFVGDYEVSTPQTVRFEGVGSTMLKWYEPIRKYNIMKAYGYSFNDSLMDSIDAQKKAAQIAANMPNWPANESINISDTMIVVKLSGSCLKEITGDREVFLQAYNSNTDQSANMWIDNISYNDNIFNIYGWSYLNDLDSAYTSIKIAFVSDTKQYVMNIKKNEREDVDAAFNSRLDGKYAFSGINEQVSLKTLDHGKYDILLILQNSEKKLCLSLEKEIIIE